MKTGRVMAMDVGDVRVGLAVSDELGWTAQGAGVVERAAREREAKAYRAVIERFGVQRLVVGLPRRLDGSLGLQAEKVKAYAVRLREDLSLPVDFQDERLTTRQASSAMIEGGARRETRRKKVDEVAAVLILQAYLDARRIRDGGTP